MPPKKSRNSNNASGTADSNEEPSHRETPKYVAGKNPRRQDFAPVIYDKPLQPDSELYRDLNWNIPEFNRFISFTIDNLIDLYRPIFKDFIKLPSRKFHPQYYYKVDQPMSLKEIKSRNYEYNGGCRDFLLDLELLAKNCNSFNEEDSLIVKNSYQVVNYVKYEVIKGKNFKRNYLINKDVKQRLLKQINKLIDSTEREIIKDMNHGDRSGRNFKPSEPFLEYVDREELAEYYEVIHRPMALNQVVINLESDKYITIYDCIIDVLLIFDNAQVFNDEDSPIYESSKLLLKYFDYLLNHMFFPELQDSKERGEITLEYNKVNFIGLGNKNNNNNNMTNSNNVTGFGGNINSINGGLVNKDTDTSSGLSHFLGLPFSNEVDDYDLNQFEGLGNGYTKTLLSADGDYLLGPNFRINSRDNNKMEPNKRQKLDIGDAKPEILKFNILKSLQKTFVSKDHEILKEPFELINQISISSSMDAYQQAVYPAANSRPPYAQNWVEYVFDMKKLNKHEHMYTLSVQPNQTSLIMDVSLNMPNLKNFLIVNNTEVPSNKPATPPPPQQQQQLQAQTEAPPSENDQTLNQNSKDDKETKLERYSLSLVEGTNKIQFKTSNQDITETFVAWINVLP